ncbi:hypothetical protein FB45DRAFT_1040128 [Roridomyces roridus]|uniref:Rhodopsin domain-containing protein n=1 Tax=Roridomyces roridus TaxID=1738132 RepID=A0AAD7B2A8_9AGAR|nr:hypothetical protein FB45DRAFT_1040128 [Roridomyces roridus]
MGFLAVNLPIDKLRILTYILCPFACLVTFFRLWVRYAHSRLWWDDLSVFIASLWTGVFVACFMLHIRDTDTNTMSQESRVVVYFLLTIAFHSIAWTVRVSILYTILRLSFGLLRRILVASAVLFFVFLGVLLMQLFWVCVPEPGWKQTALAQCDLGREVAITMIVMDVIGDTILIAAPLHLLWGVSLERSLKWRLIAVFAATSIMTASSLYHDYAVFVFGGLPEAFAATLQVAVGVFIANLSVVIAFFLRLLTGEASSVRSPSATSGVMSTALSFGRKKMRVTTFGGIETVPASGSNEAQTRMEEGVKVDIDISRMEDDADDVWDADLPRRMEGPEKMEMRVFSTSEPGVQAV